MYFLYLFYSYYKNWLKVRIGSVLYLYGAEITVFLMDFMRQFLKYPKQGLLGILLFSCAFLDAKNQHKEDYTQLLPFYNYSLNETAKGQIDSVIYKCTAGVLLHDLRSDWVDQLYLLMGNAYMHRKDFDSAALVFNYINYAFAAKDDGYDLPIGSNLSSKGGSFSISTDEKRNFWKKISSPKPARNESFLFQSRNFIEQEKLAEE